MNISKCFERLILARSITFKSYGLMRITSTALTISHLLPGFTFANVLNKRYKRSRETRLALEIGLMSRLQKTFDFSRKLSFQACLVGARNPNERRINKYI